MQEKFTLLWSSLILLSLLRKFTLTVRFVSSSWYDSRCFLSLIEVWKVYLFICRSLHPIGCRGDKQELGYSVPPRPQKLSQWGPVDCWVEPPAWVPAVQELPNLEQRESPQPGWQLVLLTGFPMQSGNTYSYPLDEFLYQYFRKMSTKTQEFLNKRKTL